MAQFLTSSSYPEHASAKGPSLNSQDKRAPGNLLFPYLTSQQSSNFTLLSMYLSSLFTKRLCKQKSLGLFYSLLLCQDHSLSCNRDMRSSCLLMKECSRVTGRTLTTWLTSLPIGVKVTKMKRGQFLSSVTSILIIQLDLKYVIGD